MHPENEAPGFSIWGVDGVVYGPVDLPALVGWVQDERVSAGTWVYQHDGDRWTKAAQMPDLQMFFRPKGARSGRSAAAPEAPARAPLRPGSLRRVKIFAEMSEEHLERFAGLMEVERVRQWAEIVKLGSPGDAMYLIVEGEVRVRIMIGGKESIIATLAAGEFFGEVALFDHGPRSADVIANKDCLLLKIPAGAFQRLISEAADLAAPFLHAICRTLIARIRADNKRYRDSVAIVRTSSTADVE